MTTAKTYQAINEMDTTSDMADYHVRESKDRRRSKIGDFYYDWHASRGEWDVVCDYGNGESVVATIRQDYSTGELYFISNLWLDTEDLSQIVRFMERNLSSK